jgi:hypothetical protein
MGCMASKMSTSGYGRVSSLSILGSCANAPRPLSRCHESRTSQPSWKTSTFITPRIHIDKLSSGSKPQNLSLARLVRLGQGADMSQPKRRRTSSSTDPSASASAASAGAAAAAAAAQHEAQKHSQVRKHTLTHTHTHTPALRCL